jgi:hypothetical protein
MYGSLLSHQSDEVFIMWGGMKVIFTIASEIPCVHDFNWEIGESSIIFLENQLTDTATKHTATCRFALLLRLAANIAEYWCSPFTSTHYVLNVVRGRNVSLRQLG